jgi:hypothetical protein
MVYPWDINVIPGRVEDANPESISPGIDVALWIPGLRLTAHPGMTAKWLTSFTAHP